MVRALERGRVGAAAPAGRLGESYRPPTVGFLKPFSILIQLLTIVQRLRAVTDKRSSKLDDYGAICVYGHINGQYG